MVGAFDAGFEWLEADGLGGFASGTRSGVRTRRYHGLLLSASTPPTGRVMLVNGFEAEVHTSAGDFALGSHYYAPDVLHPDGALHLVRFELAPWPRWRHRLADGSVVEHELFVARGGSDQAACVVVRFRLAPDVPAAVAGGITKLTLRPLCSGRDYHALQRENSAFRFDVEIAGPRARLSPYPDQPAIVWWSSGQYRHAPDWYRNFLYTEERTRGLDYIEDLASPGVLEFDLSAGPAVWILTTEHTHVPAVLDVVQRAELASQAERTRRAALGSALERAADAYVVTRGRGQTLVAGYPWFTDWGRDTFIALRGLCIATGRLALAESILLQWASAVSRGMLPNRFPDGGEEPEYNSIDASLWFIVAVSELLRARAARGQQPSASSRETLEAACHAILEGYSAGTRHGIRRDHDGLLAAGEPGVQLTWMDAKLGDWVVTPRIGKPVEIQALWLHALEFGATWSKDWAAAYRVARDAFERRFWNESNGMLYDVIDVDHESGVVDASLRPNQLFAVGGLPKMLLSLERARSVVDAVAAELYTPVGLRSLGPREPGYHPRYEGGPHERDASYHQGTVWPWLLGAFVEAVVRVDPDPRSARRQARERYLAPLLTRLGAGSGHLHEIFDAELPFTPRGCPFQAWSLGELIRLSVDVLM